MYLELALTVKIHFSIFPKRICNHNISNKNVTKFFGTYEYLSCPRSYYRSLKPFYNYQNSCNLFSDHFFFFFQICLILTGDKFSDQDKVVSNQLFWAINKKNFWLISFNSYVHKIRKTRRTDLMRNGQQLLHFFQFTALKHCAKFQEKNKLFLTENCNKQIEGLKEA